MTKPLLRSLFVCFVLVLAHARAADDAFRIDYSVEVASIPSAQFHVTAEVKNIHQDSLEFSLPVWTPGWYVIENYARNISYFSIKDPDGKRLNHERTRKQTWRVETKGIANLTVQFDYSATKLALNQAKIARDYAFFTGTQLFLMAEGHRDCASTVTLKAPADWKAVSALKETGDPRVFSAANYDELVDSPVLLGNFDVVKFEALGKPHFIVSLPKGRFPEERTKELPASLAKMVQAAGDIFGGAPYDKYVFLYFFQRAETRANGGLEHSNSHVAFFPYGAETDVQYVLSMSAHEFFHVWNVKRIRPVQLWPYDYSREVESPLLWVCEGFTTYYGSVLLYRAGLNTREEFYESCAGMIAQCESSPVREYVSPSESSASTWLGYDNHGVFELSYYFTGRNLATLLDLSILHDTEGRKSLDDLMRALYVDCYQKNKGFDKSDLLAALQKISGRDYADFFKRYVDGVERPPYEEIFGYAGLKIEFTKKRDAAGNLHAKISELYGATDAQKKIRETWLRQSSRIEK